MSTGKREGYIEWGEYYMSLAFLTARRSKDPSTQVGACIVGKDMKIIALGYNGMPNGCSDDEFPWVKSCSALHSKFTYVCHAELNAIVNKNMASVEGCTMYTTLFPCNECAKIIIQSGIGEVIYHTKKQSKKKGDLNVASEKMLNAANVKLSQWEPTGRTIEICI